MAANNLAETELLLMREISRSPIRTQRDLSQSAGLSLGMTNLLIKRLARKGLIKVNQLDWNRTQYLLTFKGALEKTRKMYDYTLYTIRIFRQIQENMHTVLRQEYARGQRRFWLVAQDEFKGLLKDALAASEFSDARFTVLSSFAEVPREADIVLTATQESAPKNFGARQHVSLVDFDNIEFRLR